MIRGYPLSSHKLRTDIVDSIPPVSHTMLTPPVNLPIGRRDFLGLGVIGLLGLPGCGYMIGSPYSAEYRTIYVPTFTTETFRRGFETQLTEAVHKQIEMRTPFQLVGGNSADTTLTGHIRRIDKRPANQNRFDDPRELELSLAVEVRWVNNRTGASILQQQIGAPAALNQLVGESSFAPEAGQSLATATQQAVDDLGRRIVGMLEGTW